MTESAIFPKITQKVRLQLKIIVPLLFVLGCAFSQKLAQDFSGIRSGMSRAQVKSIMGDPEHSTVSMLPQPPFFGPQESLVKFLKPGTSFEEWQYTDGETIYLIWFSSAKEEPQESWAVVTKFSYPKGAVF